MYSRKLSHAAVYLGRGAVHTAKAVGLCIVVVVSPPEEIECGHSGRVVVIASHRYDSSSAHLCSALVCVSHSFCSGRSSRVLVRILAVNLGCSNCVF